VVLSFGSMSRQPMRKARHRSAAIQVLGHVVTGALVVMRVTRQQSTHGFTEQPTMSRARGQQVGVSFVGEFSGSLGFGCRGGHALGVGCGHRSLPFGLGGWSESVEVEEVVVRVGSELESGEAQESELAFNRLFAVVGSGVRTRIR
jgi:hypothetical protein